jgi:hypothetical protein
MDAFVAAVNVHVVGDSDTVWWRRVCSLYNNVLQPSKLIAGADFHCFKAGIEPKWEDPKWTAQPPRSGGKAALDTYWLHTVWSFSPCAGLSILVL